MASTPLVIIVSICSCWMATSPLALPCSTVHSPHSSLTFCSNSGLSWVSQRAVVESGSSRAMFGVLPASESFPVSAPQAARATAVETAVMATAASRMRAFMRETSLVLHLVRRGGAPARCAWGEAARVHRGVKGPGGKTTTSSV
jgi:hypothetical protein